MFATFAFATMLAAATPAPETVQLTLYTEENPPYNYRSKDTGEVEGLLVTIVKEMMNRAEVDYTLALLPWRRAFNKTLTEENSCVFGMTRTAEREKNFRWVSPLFETQWFFFRRRDSDIRLSSLEDIAPYTVAATADYASARALMETGHGKILLASDNLDLLTLLHYGRVDLMVTGDYEIPYLAGVLDIPEPVVALPFHKVLMSMGCSLKTDPDLVQKLQTVNLEMADFKKAVLGE